MWATYFDAVKVSVRTGDDFHNFRRVELRVVEASDQLLPLHRRHGLSLVLDAPSADLAIHGVVDTFLCFADPPGDVMAGNPTQVVDLAYSPPSPTSLYGIDSVLDTLVRFDTSNMGALHTVGFLGVNPTDIVGFDIGSDGTAFAAMNTPGAQQTGLYRIDLNTGAAMLIGNIGQGQLIIGDIAIAPIPTPGTLGLIGMAGLMVFGRRRRS